MMDQETLAVMAMRLRAVTGLPVTKALDVLKPLSPEMRRRYVVQFENHPQSMLFDPIEVAPEYAAAISTIRQEAERRLAAGEFDQGRRGRSFRMWRWMQDELFSRFGIVWRTPAQMSPWLALD